MKNNEIIEQIYKCLTRSLYLYEGRIMSTNTDIFRTNSCFQLLSQVAYHVVYAIVIHRLQVVLWISAAREEVMAQNWCRSWRSGCCVHCPIAPE